MPQLRHRRAAFIDSRDATIAQIAQFLTEINETQAAPTSSWKHSCSILVSFLLGTACMVAAGLLNFGTLAKDYTDCIPILVTCGAVTMLAGFYVLLYEYLRIEIDENEFRVQ